MRLPPIKRTVTPEQLARVIAIGHAATATDSGPPHEFPPLAELASWIEPGVRFELTALGRVALGDQPHVELLP